MSENKWAVRKGVIRDNHYKNIAYGLLAGFWSAARVFRARSSINTAINIIYTLIAVTAFFFGLKGVLYVFSLPFNAVPSWLLSGIVAGAGFFFVFTVSQRLLELRYGHKRPELKPDKPATWLEQWVDERLYHRRKLCRSLLDAASGGNSETVKQLLNQGCYADTRSFNGRTPLMLAAWDGHMETARLLISSGADVNSRCTTNDRTPLIYAATCGRTSTVELLLKHGAKLDAKESVGGRTALHFAAQNGHAGTVDLLLQFNADAEARTASGHTPLMLAAERWPEPQIVKALAEHGVDVNKRNLPDNEAQIESEERKISAVKKAISGDFTDAAKTVLADIPQQAMMNGWSALMYAAHAGHADSVRVLLAFGARQDITSVDNEKTALTLAEEKGWTDVIEILRQAEDDDQLGPSEMKNSARTGFKEEG
jgi:ankyrin repeat protein